MTSVTVTLSQFPYPITVQFKPVVPLVANMSVVLVVDVVVRLVLAVLVGGRHSKLGHEPGVSHTFLEIQA